MGDTPTPSGDAWAAYLRRVRKARDLTVQQLADAAGVGRSTIQDWQANGGSEKIKVETIVAIARAVGDHPVNAFVAAAGLIEEEPHDEEIGQIVLSDLPDEEKQRQIQLIEDKRERDKRNRMSDTQEMLRIHGRRAS